MEFFETIEKRASYRNAFLEKEIPEEDIRRILTAGLYAPSGYNMQTTSFVVVRDTALKKAISELLPTPATKSAAVIIVALSEEKAAKAAAGPVHFETEDYAAAVENIMLAITACGYAGVWMDGMTRTEGTERKIAELLNVPAGKSVRTIIPFGVPEKEAKQMSKKPFDERVTWDKF